jgi:hypothetical protein
MEHPSFHVQHYIDGAFVEGTRRFEIFYPATNQVIGSAPEGREDEVDAAVQAATRAFAPGGAPAPLSGGVCCGRSPMPFARTLRSSN